MDVNLYEIDAETANEIPTTPISLGHALAALEKDYDYLLKGDVFSEDLIRTWIDFKKQNEVQAMRLQPHPLEFCMYFDS